MPGTSPEMTIPATAPGESASLAAKAAVLDPAPSVLAAASADQSQQDSVGGAAGGIFAGSGGVGGVGPTDPVPNLATIASRRESVALKGAEEKKGETALLKQFVNDGRHFSLVRNFRLADAVTIMNGFCGAMSVLSSARYLISSDTTQLWLALWFPLFGLFFDFADGRVARWRNETSMLGQELDSLADSISFGVAPAVLGFTLGLRTTLDCCGLAAFTCCGIARLARYNATVATASKDATGKIKHFEGLPIPSTLVLVGLMALCVRTGNFEAADGQGKGLPFGLVGFLERQGVDFHWETVVFGLWATAMVSKTLKVPKP